MLYNKTTRVLVWQYKSENALRASSPAPTHIMRFYLFIGYSQEKQSKPHLKTLNYCVLKARKNFIFLQAQAGVHHMSHECALKKWECWGEMRPPVGRWALSLNQNLMIGISRLDNGAYSSSDELNDRIRANCSFPSSRPFLCKCMLIGHPHPNSINPTRPRRYGLCVPRTYGLIYCHVAGMAGTDRR